MDWITKYQQNDYYSNISILLKIQIKMNQINAYSNQNLSMTHHFIIYNYFNCKQNEKLINIRIFIRNFIIYI